MAGYTREFLIEASVHKFKPLGEEAVQQMRALSEKTYDMYGKDKFRVYCALDAEAIRKYKQIMAA